jgi:Flavodoxin
MRATIVYESMYGNTRLIAQAISEGIAPADVAVVPVREVSPELLEASELIVVGGPTHVRGMSRPATRKGAVAAAAKPGSEQVAEPGADGPGLREWLATTAGAGRLAVAFDTRLRTKFAGRASKGITKMLGSRSFEPAAAPQSFFVTKDNRLEDGEEQRAREWGRRLAQASPSRPTA